MGRTHFYVIGYNEDEAGWDLYPEVEERAFPLGTLMDNDTGAHTFAYRGDEQFEDNVLELDAIIAKTINTLNRSKSWATQQD